MSAVYEAASKRDQKMLQVLKLTLKKNGIPSYSYHIGGYAEESVCLERVANGWDVYIGERGNRYEVMSYSDLKSACIRVFDQVAESGRQFQKMYHAFACTLRDEALKNNATTSVVLHEKQPQINAVEVHRVGVGSKTIRYKKGKAAAKIVASRVNPNRKKTKTEN